MKLKAKQVQEMLGVEDFVVIAHGYTFERQTLDIWFEAGKLVRATSTLSRTRRGEDELAFPKEESEDFDPQFFHTNVKRWYQGSAEHGFNQKLLDLFDTFNFEPVSMTIGGHYPDSSPF